MTTVAKTILRQADTMIGLLVRLCFVLACCALVAIVCITIYEIVMRYFLNSPTIWVSDAVRYLLACVILLGLPDVTLRQGHVSIDLVSSRFDVASRYRRFLFLVGALTCFFVSWLVLNVFLSQLSSQILTHGLWQIPRFWITGAILIGFFLSGLTFLILMLSPRPKE